MHIISQRRVKEFAEHLQEAIQIWPYLDPLLKPPQTEEEFSTLLAMIDYLANTINSVENHPLHSLLMLFSRLAWENEQAHDPRA